MKTPCNNCPWRRDAPVEHWDPDHFRSIWRNCQDDGQHVMLCHKAGSLPEEAQGTVVCQGWVRVMGTQAVGVRVALMQKRVTPDELEGGTEGLFDSFEEMMVANGIELPLRNRWKDIDPAARE
jgi:uncharacterized protein DUF6283